MTKDIKDELQGTNPMKEAAPRIGQEVVVCHSGSWNTHHYFGYHITKITPSGQVVVHNGTAERRFDKRGYEMGTGMSYPDRLDYDAPGIRASEQRRNRATVASRAILEVRVDDCSHRYGKDSMMEKIAFLELKLAAARLAVEAI